MASEAAGSTAPRAGGGRGALLRDRGWARTRRSASLLGWTGGVGAHATSASLPCGVVVVADATERVPPVRRRGRGRDKRVPPVRRRRGRPPPLFFFLSLAHLAMAVNFHC